MIKFYDKKQAKTKMTKSIIRYLLFLVVANIAIVWGINKKTEPTKQQKFNVFVSVNVSDSFKSDIRSVLSDSIYEVNIYSFPYTDSYYNQYYTLYGPGESDIVITPTQGETSATNNFYSLPYPVEKGLSYNDKLYGLKVYDSETNSGSLVKYMNTALPIPLYLFVPTNSVHFSGENSTILQVINQLFL